MLNQLQSIPTVFQSVMIGFLIVAVMWITYPIVNVILGLMTPGTMMYYAGVLGWFLVIIFVCWFLVWIKLFDKGGQTQEN